MAKNNAQVLGKHNKDKQQIFDEDGFPEQRIADVESSVAFGGACKIFTKVLATGTYRFQSAQFRALTFSASSGSAATIEPLDGTWEPASITDGSDIDLPNLSSEPIDIEPGIPVSFGNGCVLDAKFEIVVLSGTVSVIAAA